MGPSARIEPRAVEELAELLTHVDQHAGIASTEMRLSVAIDELKNRFEPALLEHGDECHRDMIDAHSTVDSGIETGIVGHLLDEHWTCGVGGCANQPLAERNRIASSLVRTRPGEGDEAELVGVDIVDADARRLGRNELVQELEDELSPFHGRAEEKQVL